MDRTRQLLLGIQHQHTYILRAADEIGRARAAQLVPGAEAPQNAAARKPGLTCKLLEQWRMELEERQLSKTTIGNYTKTVNRYLKFMG